MMDERKKYVTEMWQPFGDAEWQKDATWLSEKLARERAKHLSAHTRTHIRILVDDTFLVEIEPPDEEDRPHPLMMFKNQGGP